MRPLPQDYTEQDIKNELETQEAQIQINLSLETQVFLHYHYGSRNRRKLLKTVFRANVMLEQQLTDKTRHLSLKAVEIANAILNKLVNGKNVLLSHEYLSKITECGTSKQNNNIIAQLSNLFDITPHNFLYRNGKVYRHNVEFKLKASVLEEAKDSGALISEFNWKKISSPINNNNITSNRSIRSRANFVNAKNFNSETSNTELDETQKLVAKGECDSFLANQSTTEPVETFQEAQAIETQDPKVATVTPIQTKPSRPRNKRKTRTQAEQKQRKASTVQATNVVQNGFLGGGKRLSEIQPFLTDELCETLRSKSGKLFTNKAIREITKAIAASKKGSKAIFQHVNGIVAYLTPALIKEKRDPNKIGGEGYYTVAGMTEEDKQLHKQENYLNQAENSAIHARCDYTQFRARIAGQFPVNLAYSLLTSMIGIKKQGSILEINMHKQIPLSQHYKQLLLKHATGVGGYSGVSELEFVGVVSNSNIVSDLTYPKKQASLPDAPPVGKPEELQLPQGKWGKVCSLFISQQEGGEALYNHWLAPLSVVEKDDIIELSTTSDMVRDRIEQTYLPFLNKVAGEFGIIEILLA